MSDVKCLEGVLTKIYRHPLDRYGLKIGDDERWFNGFYLPTHLKEGVKISIEYVEKPGVDTIYYDVVSITDDVHTHTDLCPRCQCKIRFNIL